MLQTYQAQWWEEKPTDGAGQNNNHRSETSSSQHDLTLSMPNLHRNIISPKTLTSFSIRCRHPRYVDVIPVTLKSFTYLSMRSSVNSFRFIYTLRLTFIHAFILSFLHAFLHASSHAFMDFLHSCKSECMMSAYRESAYQDWVSVSGLMLIWFRFGVDTMSNCVEWMRFWINGSYSVPRRRQFLFPSPRLIDLEHNNSRRDHVRTYHYITEDYFFVYSFFFQKWKQVDI